jgi:hypothetical protein
MTAAPISLGFSDGLCPVGVHVCQVFSDDIERDRALGLFLQEGLRTGERCACYSDHVSAEKLAQQLASAGIAWDRVQSAVTIAKAAKIYLEGGQFQPDRVLQELAAFHQSAVANGFPAARVIGEVPNNIEHESDGLRLLEYESRVTLLLREHPMSVVCQYDARSFDGASIMDVLRVHPLVVVRGTIVQNPFYLSPEEFLKTGRLHE